MSESEIILWILNAVMASIAFGFRLAKVLGKSEYQKRIEQINRDADELVKQAQEKINKRERLDTNGVSYD